eukprot:2495811-Amphidinium_carterae.2
MNMRGWMSFDQGLLEALGKGRHMTCLLLPMMLSPHEMIRPTCTLEHHDDERLDTKSSFGQGDGAWTAS